MMKMNAREESKIHWHTFMLLGWLVILWCLLVAGCVVPHIRTRFSSNGGGCLEYGLFLQVTHCSGEPSSWSSCIAEDNIMLPASCFAAFSLIAVSAAILFAIVNDVCHALVWLRRTGVCRALELDTSFPWGTGILAVGSWGLITVTWALIAVFFNSNFSVENGTRTQCMYSSQKRSANSRMYISGFYLFIIGWIITAIVLVVWFVKEDGLDRSHDRNETTLESAAPQPRMMEVRADRAEVTPPTTITTSTATGDDPSERKNSSSSTCCICLENVRRRAVRAPVSVRAVREPSKPPLRITG